MLFPPHSTDCLQPLDVSVNKAVQNQLRAEFQHWHACQICHQHQEGQKKPINLKMSAVKPLSASWIVSACVYVKSNPEIIINGFKESGLLPAMCVNSMTVIRKFMDITYILEIRYSIRVQLIIKIIIQKFI